MQPTKVLILAEVAQLVEHNLAKVRVAGSNLVFRSKIPSKDGIFYFESYFFRPGGGIGRHAGLKILFAEKASAGSSPAPGTSQIFAIFLLLKGCITKLNKTTAKAPITFNHNHPISVKAYMASTQSSPKIAA